MASARGCCYEQMPERLRARDPLIEAARMAELTQARMPGFGKKLFAFLEPLFADARPRPAAPDQGRLPFA